ncbi:hypothetical protein [Lactiplantibacillus daowaiensis]|uniref:Glycine cleavage system protein H n=1 Tax=Lactiplantibacillus daowaiensis TaxID=2559918 RepID=A0ABW1S3R2_9LACO|nr:hypothetical protein [Lactiplantibacillus daowaiensis]
MASAFRETWDYFKDDWLTHHSKVTTTYDGVWLQSGKHDHIVLGLTDDTKTTLGTITAITYPSNQTSLQAGAVLATLTGTQATITLKVPVGGTVIGYNTDLQAQPDQSNHQKMAKNWLVELQGD